MGGRLGPDNRSVTLERTRTGLPARGGSPPRLRDGASHAVPTRAASGSEAAHDGGQAHPARFQPAEAGRSVDQAIRNRGIDSGLLRELEEGGVTSMGFLQPVQDPRPGGQLFERRQPLPPQRPRQLESRAQPDQGCHVAWRLGLPIEAPQSVNDRPTVP